MGGDDSLDAKSGFSTQAIHAGQQPDPTTGAVMTPIYQTSTYAQEALGKNKGFEYARTHNATRAALEGNLAALEGGKHGLCFASGLAATNTLIQTLSAGDHVVAGDNLYGGTFRLFDKVWRRHRARVHVRATRAAPTHRGGVHAQDAHACSSRRRPTRMMQLTDIAAVSRTRARAGHQGGGRQHVHDARTSSARSSSAPTWCCTR